MHFGHIPTNLRLDNHIIDPLHLGIKKSLPIKKGLQLNLQRKHQTIYYHHRYLPKLILQLVVTLLSLLLQLHKLIVVKLLHLLVKRHVVV